MRGSSDNKWCEEDVFGMHWNKEKSYEEMTWLEKRADRWQHERRE